MKYKLKQGDNLELLKKLPDIDQKYSISPEGFVLNEKTNKLVIFHKDNKGYMKSRLYSPLSKNPDGRKSYRLHRIIAMTFLEDYSDELQVNHINGDKSDNRVENLEMVTASQNVYHAWNKLDDNGDRRRKLKRCPITGKFIKK